MCLGLCDLIFGLQLEWGPANEEQLTPIRYLSLLRGVTYDDESASVSLAPIVAGMEGRMNRSSRQLRQGVCVRWDVGININWSLRYDYRRTVILRQDVYAGMEANPPLVNSGSGSHWHVTTHLVLPCLERLPPLYARVRVQYRVGGGAPVWTEPLPQVLDVPCVLT